jgi:cell division initiation protein
MFLSPPELQHHKLKSRLGSYDREDVDELLFNAATSYDQVWKERDDARKRIAVLEERLNDYEELERLLRDSLVTGQRAAQEVKAEAAEQADQIVRDAKEKARQIVAQAERDRERISTEIARLQTVERDVQTRCRQLLVGALEAIGSDERRPQADGAPRREAAAAG